MGLLNVSRKQGFLPVRHLNGSPYNGQVQLMNVLAGDGTAIFVGDAVKYDTSGSGALGVTVSGVDIEGLPSCISVGTGTISAGTSIVGVAVGFSVDPTARYQRSRLASTARLVYVVDAFDVFFEIQEDGVTTPITAAQIGTNGSFTGGTGDTTLFTSTSVLISTSFTTTSTLPLRLQSLVKRPGMNLSVNNSASASPDPAKFLVTFNATGVSAGGVGILAHS